MTKRQAEYGELIKGTTPILILAVLATEPLHGYAIARAIEERTGRVLCIAEGSLYPALHRAERQRLVKSHWEIGDRGRRRKVYALTRGGRAALERGERSWWRFAAAVGAVLMGGDYARSS